MIEVFYIGQTDTLPYYKMEARDIDGVVSLSAVQSVYFCMENISTGSAVLSAVAIITDTLNGQCEYRWSIADTSTTGEYSVCFIFVTAAGIFSLPRNEIAKVVVEDRPGDS